MQTSTLHRETLTEIERYIHEQPDSLLKDVAVELAVRLQKAEHALNDTLYQYAGGRISRHAILTRNAEIARLQTQLEAKK